ncbi:putative inorganic polyphosphate/ATP-NAD kinase [Phycisphaerae bacterium RAS1]|nr:putative inorganic polyphosphate/ATP-NAD kinase [Phycisphaerae bacterium RAS1]
MTRVAIIGSPSKPHTPEKLARLLQFLKGRAEVVFAERTYDAGGLPAARPDLVIVLGGDGTLISAVHALGQAQAPIIGINLGKLGYLTDFTVEDVEHYAAELLSSSPPVTRRLMLAVSVEHNGSSFVSPAANDCVVLAGPPFRIVDLEVRVDGDEVAQIRGDGLIVATPTGSTAHNLSAGGPILEPTAESFVLTPMCPHALTFRPVVLDARREIAIRINDSNESTNAVVDGRIVHALQPGDRVVIRRYPADFLLVRHPRHSAWSTLRRKLMWGAPPER